MELNLSLGRNLSMSTFYLARSLESLNEFASNVRDIPTIGLRTRTSFFPHQLFKQPIVFAGDFKHLVELHSPRFNTFLIEVDQGLWVPLNKVPTAKNKLGKETLNQRLIRFLGEENCHTINRFYIENPEQDLRLVEAYHKNPASYRSFEWLIAFTIRAEALGIYSVAQVHMTAKGLLVVDITHNGKYFRVTCDPEGYNLLDTTFDISELTLNACIEQIQRLI